MEACYGEQKKSLPLIVIDGSGPVLLGRNWLEHIRLDWGMLGVAAIHHTAADTLAPILDRYAIVFDEDLGCITPYKANLQLQPDARPKFHKARLTALCYLGSHREGAGPLGGSGDC